MTNFSPEPRRTEEDSRELWAELRAESSRVIFPKDTLTLGGDIRLELRRLGDSANVVLIADASILASKASGRETQRFTSFGLCSIDCHSFSCRSEQLSLGIDGVGTPLFVGLEINPSGISFNRLSNLLPFLEEYSLEIPTLSLISNYRSAESALKRVWSCLRKNSCSPFEMTSGELNRILHKEHMSPLAIEEGIELARYLWIRETIFDLLRR